MKQLKMAIAVHSCDPSSHDMDAGGQKLILGYIAQVLSHARACAVCVGECVCVCSGCAVRVGECMWVMCG